MYNKLFSKILDSSIWLECDATRIVWFTFLASMDEDGFCQFASIANLAHRAIVSIDAAENAVKILSDPDPNSSDPDNEGRRIERVPGGWIVLNATKYRDLATREQVKAGNRRRQQAARDRKRSVTPESRSVTQESQSITQESLYQTQTHTQTHKDQNLLFEKAYNAYPRRVGRPAAEKAWAKVGSRINDLADLPNSPLRGIGDKAEEFIYRKVVEYAAACHRMGKEKQFIPHMATWLNQDRFMDEPSEWVETNGQASKAERRIADVAAKTRRIFGTLGEVSGGTPKCLPGKLT